MGPAIVDGKTNSALLVIVDTAMVEAVRRSGPWIACRPGCTPCCHGHFDISQPDALRLREGLADLEHSDPDRAARIRDRARVVYARNRELADDEPCPVLDPASGTCDLYSARPITCRVFGPAVRGSGGEIGVCELCYHGATDEEIAGCAVDLDLESGDIEDISIAGCLAGDNSS